MYHDLPRCRQVLVVPFGSRPGSRGDHPQARVFLRRTPALRQLPPQAPGHSRPAPRGTAPQTELLLRSRRLPKESDAATRYASSAERSTSAPSSSSSAPCGKGRRHVGSASSPSASASTDGPSLAGRSSGANTFPRHRSGSSHAPSGAAGRDRHPAVLARGCLPQPPSPLSGLDAPAAVSLADHDPRRPENRGLAMMSSDPQKMHVA